MVYSSNLIISVFEQHILFWFSLLHRRQPSNLLCQQLPLGRGEEAAEGNYCGGLETPLAGRKGGPAAGALLLSPNSSSTSSCKHLYEQAECPKNLPSSHCYLIRPALSQVVFAATAPERGMFWETSKRSPCSAASRGRGVNLFNYSWDFRFFSSWQTALFKVFQLPIHNWVYARWVDIFFFLSVVDSFPTLFIK